MLAQPPLLALELYLFLQIRREEEHSHLELTNFLPFCLIQPLKFSKNQKNNTLLISNSSLMFCAHKPALTLTYYLNFHLQYTPLYLTPLNRNISLFPEKKKKGTLILAPDKASLNPSVLTVSFLCFSLSYEILDLLLPVVHQKGLDCCSRGFVPQEFGQREKQDVGALYLLREEEQYHTHPRSVFVSCFVGHLG